MFSVATCGSDVDCARAIADPFASDANYVLCVLTLEELGATGNKARASQPARGRRTAEMLA